jgi:hypothetical protein
MDATRAWRASGDSQPQTKDAAWMRGALRPCLRALLGFEGLDNCNTATTLPRDYIAIAARFFAIMNWGIVRQPAPRWGAEPRLTLWRPIAVVNYQSGFGAGYFNEKTYQELTRCMYECFEAKRTPIAIACNCLYPAVYEHSLYGGD